MKSSPFWTLQGSFSKLSGVTQRMISAAGYFHALAFVPDPDEELPFTAGFLESHNRVLRQMLSFENAVLHFPIS